MQTFIAGILNLAESVLLFLLFTVYYNFLIRPMFSQPAHSSPLSLSAEGTTRYRTATSITAILTL